MAKHVDIACADRSLRFVARRIERKTLYGYRRRVALDEMGNECATGLLTRDGAHLLTKGCTAFVHLDGEGNQIERGEAPEPESDSESPREGRSAGRPLRYRAVPVAPEVVLSHVATRVDALLVNAGDGALTLKIPDGCYQLQADEVCAGESAFLVVNDSGVFLLHCEDCGFAFTGPEAVAPMPHGDEASEFEFGDEDLS